VQLSDESVVPSSKRGLCAQSTDENTYSTMRSRSTVAESAYRPICGNLKAWQTPPYIVQVEGMFLNGLSEGTSGWEIPMQVIGRMELRWGPITFP